MGDGRFTNEFVPGRCIIGEGFVSPAPQNDSSSTRVVNSAMGITTALVQCSRKETGPSIVDKK